jgi:integrase
VATKGITIRAVQALKPGSQIWDAGQDAVKGLGVRRQRRDPVYVLKYRFNGRQRFVTIGRHGSPWTPVTARREARRLLGLVAGGIDPAADRDAAKELPTVATFADRYIAEYAIPHKKPRTTEEDKRLLRLHILPALGTKRLSEVTRADIVRLHNARGAHPANANRCLALLSHLFATAEKWGLLREGAINPVLRIQKFPEKKRERLLTASELARLGEALAQAERGWTEANLKVFRSAERPARKTPEDWRAIACYRLLLFTGARLSEILTLKWAWIDWERGVARLPDSKTGAKNLHLSDPAIALLKALPRFEDNPWVLPGNRLDSRFVGIQKPWQRIRKLAKLPDLRIHDLRHAFASLAVANNEAIYLVGAVLGHRQVTTTQRYSHLSDDPVKAVANRTSERIAAMLSSQPVADTAPLRRPRPRKRQASNKRN